jgi:hypothetical protein
MKILIKIMSLLIIAILVLTSVYMVYFTGATGTCGETIIYDDNYKNENQNDEPIDDNGNDNDDDNNGNLDTSHHVFIEETTDPDCEPCVAVGEYLHELYESGDYPFYYISLVWTDRGRQTATDYVENHYNTLANPVVYIDGGFVVLSGRKEKSVYEDEIKSALKRNRPSVYINVSAEWDKNESELNIEGNIKNEDGETYNGFLRVYLAEIISTELQNREKEPYHFAFIKFIIEKQNVKISASKAYNFSKSLNVSDLDPNNLMVYAVVFNSKSFERFSFLGNQNPFNAHFADDADATEVVEGGNLPPIVKIIIPEAGKLHIGGNPFGDFVKNIKDTYIVGKLTVKAEAEDDSGIEKVEFLLDGNLISTDEEEPYEFILNKGQLIRRFFIPQTHTITLIAYDNEEKTNSVSMEIKTIWF